MTKAEKVQYLKQYKTLDRRINRLLEELARWRAKAEAISPVCSDMPRGGASEDRMATAIEHIIELERRINAEVDQLVTLRRAIELHIEILQDDKQREIMRYRYIDGLTMEQAAERMSLSYQWVWALHRRALQKIQIT